MIKFLKNSKICFIGAHPDDIELGCGALISSLTNKKNIFTITLSKINPNNEDLSQESFESLNFLGIPKSNIIFEDFKVRCFHNLRQDICDYLYAAMNKKYKFDVIFIHSLLDLHQDHEVVSRETLRVSRYKTIIGYEAFSNGYKYIPNCFCEVSKRDLDRKLKALRFYEVYKEKSYFSEELIISNIVKNGAMIGKKYAEGFDLIRLSSFL